MITKGKDGNPAKMFPDRIEKTIYCCPAVEQCCAIGIPDKDRINIPIAYVQLKSKEDEETAKRNIFDICRKNLPDYMVPDEIWFLYDIPRTSRRKIDYRALEKLAEKENNN